mgnify:CR=1 FL=1
MRIDLHANAFLPDPASWPGLTVARRGAEYYGGLRLYPFGLRTDFLRPKGYGCGPVIRQSPFFVAIGVSHRRVNFSVLREETTTTKVQAFDLRLGLGLRFQFASAYVEGMFGYSHRLQNKQSGDQAILSSYQHTPFFWSANVGYNF